MVCVSFKLNNSGEDWKKDLEERRTRVGAVAASVGLFGTENARTKNVAECGEKLL